MKPFIQPTPYSHFKNQFDPDYMHFKNFSGKLQNFPVIKEFANLRIMTYNVWFEGYNAETRHQAIIKMILKSNANVVCLQECTNEFLNKLQNCPEIMAKYKHFGFQDFKTFYGIVIMSEWPPANIYEYTYDKNQFPSRQNEQQQSQLNRKSVSPVGRSSMYDNSAS